MKMSTKLKSIPFEPVPGNPVINIALPSEGQIRTRKIVKRSNDRPTGKYPSLKLNRMVQWESENERNVYKLLDADPTVISFSEQPCVISYVLNGQVHLHYPDTYVETASSTELWEIKSARYAERQEIVERTTLLTAALPAYGFTYKLIVADELRKSTHFKNVCMLLQNARQTLLATEREPLRRLIDSVDCLTWGTVKTLGKNARTYVCQQLLSGAYQCDMSALISDATQIWHNNTPQSVSMEV